MHSQDPQDPMVPKDSSRAQELSPTGRTLEEHRAYMQGIVAVEEMLHQGLDDEGRWLEALKGRLDELAEVLATHFEAEQEGGLYRDLPFRFPHFAARLEGLQCEHPEILERLDKIRETAAQLDPAKTHHLRQLEARVQLLVAVLRRHEAEENEIVISAYWEDLGTGD